MNYDGNPGSRLLLGINLMQQNETGGFLYNILSIFGIYVVLR
jgi:hypothetical protein